MSMIFGKTITAGMNANNTSVKEMLTLMGVEATDEMTNEAMNFFLQKQEGITMAGLYDFLNQKGVMGVAKVVDVR